MNQDVIEEWHHVKFGTPSPIDAALHKTPESYLIARFGNTNYLPELKRYYDVTKFDTLPHVDTALSVLQFVPPLAKWVGLVRIAWGFIWQVLRKRRN